MTKILGSDQPSLELMLRFVSQSKLVKQLSEIPRSPAESSLIEGVKSAIHSGKWSADVFSNPNASLFTLYLMKINAISLNEGWTVLIYLMALAQFTNKHSLRKEDEQTKILREVEVLSFAEKNHPFVQAYNEGLSEKNKEMAQALFEQVEQFSPVEKWLIKISFSPENLSEVQKDEIIRFTERGLVLWHPIFKLHQDYLLIPSYSFIAYHLKLQNPELFITPVPVYGRINKNTLLEFHNKKMHPVTFYSLLVYKNLSNVHGNNCGPIPVFMHDFFMYLWLCN